MAPSLNNFNSTLRPVSLLPNLFTTASLACGLLAMYNVVAIQDGSKRACWYILLAAVLDTMDGLMARMTNSESRFGEEYDSLADAIVFGTTPALLMFLHISSEGFGTTTFMGRFTQFSCMVFTICGVLRLARFNTTQAGTGKKTFEGLPIPGAAAMVVSSYLLATWNDSMFLLRLLPFIMLFLALMMVSKFPFQSLKSIDIESPKSFETLLGAIMVVAAVFVLKSQIIEYFELIIFTLLSVYIVSGPITFFVQKFRRSDTSNAIPDGDTPPIENRTGASIHEMDSTGSD